jgi:membrane protein
VGFFIYGGIDLATAAPAKPVGENRLRRAGQAAVALCRDFMRHDCLVRASALSFTTVLSMVPVFALTFAVLKGLGVQNMVEPFILEQVTAGSREIVSRIVAYINNTSMKSVGAAGVLGVIFTALSLLSSVEEAFNSIWGVPETRSLLRKFSDYLSILFTGPLLILTALTLTTTLQSQSLIQWLIRRTYVGDFLLFLFHLVPYVSVWIAFVFLYILMPNTKVRIRSAFVGGILAGTAWQAAQWGYVHFQVGVSRYNAIYGTLATLPIFMVWIYISWVIVLVGMEVVCLHQNQKSFLEDVRHPAVSFATREILAVGVFAAVCRAFESELPPPSTERLSAEMGIPERLVREILGTLEEISLATRLAGEDRGWQPLHPPERVRIADVLCSVRRAGGIPPEEEPALTEELRTLAARIEESLRLSLGDATMFDLAGPSSARPSGGSSPR